MDGLRALPVPMIAGLLIALIMPIITIVAYMVTFRDLTVVAQPDRWGQFGDFFGGTLGWLISLIALFAIYATYLKEQEVVRHAERTGLDNKLTSQIQILLQVIGGWNAEHKNRGRIGGHDLLQDLEEQVWYEYVSRVNRGVSPFDAWKGAHHSALNMFMANWGSLYGQLALIVRTICNFTVRESVDRQQGADMLLPHISSGIALLCAIEAQLRNDLMMKEFLADHAALKSVKSNRRDAMLKHDFFLASAFGESPVGD
jgi:large-conductance mechanosensitive channel